MSTGTLLILIFGGAALLIALALGAVLWRIGRYKRAVALARSWPSVPGRIVAAGIRGRDFYVPQGHRTRTFGVVLAYEYEVGGRRHRSERYSLSGPQHFSFEGRAKRLLAKFPVGTPVTVHYDPAAPDAGVIALSAPAIFVLRFVFWFVLVLAAWLIGAPLVFEPGLFSGGTVTRP